MFYVIINENDRILSKYTSDDYQTIIQWHGAYNDEGGYLQNALILNETQAEEIHKSLPGSKKIKVKEFSVWGFCESIEDTEKAIEDILESMINESKSFEQ